MRKLLFLVAVASFWACDDGDGGASDVDAGRGDATAPDGGAPDPDGSRPDPDGSPPDPDGHVPDPDGGGPDPDGSTPDPDGGGPDPDGGPDPEDPLTGTPLEGLPVVQSAPLVLCNEFTENAPLEEERARKVRVTIPPQAPTTVHRRDLAAATLAGLLVERGPLAAERWRPADATTEVRLYEVQPKDDGTLLHAQVQHDLGAAGKLVVAFGLSRVGDAPAPVDLGGDEVTFAWWPADADPEQSQGAYLRPCGGPAGLEDIEEVLVARGGGRTMVVQRYRRGSSGDFSAGSEPMYVQEHRVTLSGHFAAASARDFFSSVYAAEHHNWNEHTLIDFGRDLVHYALYFGHRPHAGGVALDVLREVALVDTTPIDRTSSARAVLQNLASGARTTLDFDEVSGWSRVDAAALRRRLEGVCDADVHTIGGFAVGFRLLACPQAAAPGYALRGLVPLEFEPDPSLIGAVFDDAASIRPVTVDGRPGHVMDIGDWEVEVTMRDAPPEYWVKVRDAQGAQVHESLMGRLDGGPRHQPDDVLRARSADGAVEMTLVRRYAGQGVGISAVYAPASFALTFGGQTHVADAWDALDYENTHHNWNDALEARAGDVRLRWGVEYQLDSGDLVHTVSAVGPDDAVLLPETRVELLPPN